MLLLPVLLKVAVLLNWSALPFPNHIPPDPASVIVVTPLKILFPLLTSLEGPFLVEFTVPLNVQPSKSSVGLTVVILPPNAEVGPNCRMPVPVKVRLWVVGPDWV